MMMDCETCEGQDTCCSQVVRITPMEAQRLGLPKGTDFMNLDNSICEFFLLGRCQVYNKRPRACIDFNCCSAKQLSITSGHCTAEEWEELKRSLTPSTWLSYELKRRS